MYTIIGLIVSWLALCVGLNWIFIVEDAELLIKDTIGLREWLKNAKLLKKTTLWSRTIDGMGLFIFELKYMTLFAKYYAGDVTTARGYYVARWSPLHKEIEAKFKELNEKN